MSAYIVDKAHIDVIVATALDGPDGIAKWAWHGPVVPADGDAIGTMLHAENVASVNARYPADEAEAGPYTYVKPARRLTVIEALKALQGFAYQASEHDGWRTSDAESWVEQMTAALVSVLPGYEGAPWAWTATEAAAPMTHRG